MLVRKIMFLLRGTVTDGRQVLAKNRQCRSVIKNWGRAESYEKEIVARFGRY